MSEIQVKLKNSGLKTCKIDPEETTIHDLLIQLLIPPEYGIFVSDLQSQALKRKEAIRKTGQTNLENNKKKTKKQTRTKKEKGKKGKRQRERERERERKRKRSKKDKLYEPEYFPELEFKGKFADRDDLVWKYHDKCLEIREKPPKQIDIELINVSKVFRSNSRKFESDLELRGVINELAQTDSLIRSARYGIVFTYSEPSRRDIYISAPEEIRRGEQLRIILEQTNKFGVWANFQKDYRLEGYLSKIGNKFDLVRVSLKPIVIGILLPGDKEYEILVDSNCALSEICKKIVRHFGFKKTITKQNKKLEIIYHLYKVEYGDEGEKMVITQLRELDPTKSLGELNILNGSMLKLVRSEKEPEKNKRGFVSENMNFWRELGSNINRVTFWSQEINKNSKSVIVKKNNILLNKLSGVSLNKLIEFLTTPGFESQDFVEIFLLLLPTFTNENTVIDRLLERFDVPSINPETRRAFLDNERLDIQILVTQLVFRIIEINSRYLPISSKKKLQKFLEQELLENKEEKLKNYGREIDYYLKYHKKRIIKTNFVQFKALHNNNNNNNKENENEKNNNNNKENGNENGNEKSNNNKEKKETNSNNNNNNGNNKENKDNKNKNNNINTIIKSLKENPERRSSETKQQISNVTNIIMDEEITLKDLDVDELSRQITLYTHYLYSKFKSNEIFEKNWTRRNKLEKSPNVIQLIARFNFLADWSSTMILKENELPLRIERLSLLIKLANELLKLNNFNDMFAVVSGIQNSPVSRLKKTFNGLSKKIKKIYNKLDSLTDVSQGCKKLMDLTRSSEPPTVPYLAEYLKILLYIEDLPDKVDNGLINWRKRMRMFEVVSEIKRFQRIGYDFHYINQIKLLFRKEVVYTEDEMWDRSCEILPPNYN